ncbi:hypothetical protein CCR75_009729 [Bremia lactucae]|uniref:Uncharacterized protein n=1 Tax=Bremia lactucae TaxID=4779 RepID=A0A976IF22_BRELC|nr:hypothetical protein CCR75_009729 [Bremia lactucae]
MPASQPNQIHVLVVLPNEVPLTISPNSDEARFVESMSLSPRHLRGMNKSSHSRKQSAQSSKAILTPHRLLFWKARLVWERRKWHST